MKALDAVYDFLTTQLAGQTIKKHIGPDSGDVIVLSLVPTGIRTTKDGKQNYVEESIQIDIERGHIMPQIPEDPPEGFEDLAALETISEKVKDILTGIALTDTIVLIQLENETGFARSGNSQAFLWTGWFRVRLDLSNYT